MYSTGITWKCRGFHLRFDQQPDQPVYKGIKSINFIFAGAEGHSGFIQLDKKTK
jgi:hypothetical protein